MKIAFLIPLTLLLALQAFSQSTTISGKLVDNKKNPIPGGSISIKDTYDGVTTDSAGNFRFSTVEKGNQVLVFSSMGYKSQEQPVVLNGTAVEMTISLKE